MADLLKRRIQLGCKFICGMFFSAIPLHHPTQKSNRTSNRRSLPWRVLITQPTHVVADDGLERLTARTFKTEAYNNNPSPLYHFCTSKPSRFAFTLRLTTFTFGRLQLRARVVTGHLRDALLKAHCCQTRRLRSLLTGFALPQVSAINAGPRKGCERPHQPQVTDKSSRPIAVCRGIESTRPSEQPRSTIPAKLPSAHHA